MVQHRKTGFSVRLELIARCRLLLLLLFLLTLLLTLLLSTTKDRPAVLIKLHLANLHHGLRPRKAVADEAGDDVDVDVLVGVQHHLHGARVLEGHGGVRVAGEADLVHNVAELERVGDDNVEVLLVLLGEVEHVVGELGAGVPVGVEVVEYRALALWK